MYLKSTFGLACIATLCLTATAAPSIEEKRDIQRASAVKAAFRHAWDGYTTYAYGHDELRPLTNGTTDSR